MAVSLSVNIPESIGRISLYSDAFIGIPNMPLATQAQLRAIGYTGSFERVNF